MKKFNDYVIHLLNQNEEFSKLNPTLTEEGNIEMGYYNVYLREEDGYSIMGIESDSAQTQELWEFDKLTSEEEIVQWISFLKDEYDYVISMYELSWETGVEPFGEEGFICKWLLEETESI